MTTKSFVRMMVADLAVMVGVLMPISSTTTVSAQPMCSSPSPGEPLFVTGDCVDPRYNKPYVDIDEQRTTPVPHRYIHGGFTGTDAKFSLYFPPREQFQGR